MSESNTTEVGEVSLVRKINNYYITEAVADENGNITSFKVLPFPEGFDPKVENQGAQLRKMLKAEIKKGNLNYINESATRTKAMYIMFTSGAPVTSECVYEKKYVAHG